MNEMVRWHRRLNGCEFEQIMEDSEGHGSLECCSPWGRKQSDTTERQNNNNKCQVREANEKERKKHIV